MNLLDRQPPSHRRPHPSRERARRIARAFELSEIAATPWWQQPDPEPDYDPTIDLPAVADPVDLPLAA